MPVNFFTSKKVLIVFTIIGLFILIATKGFRSAPEHQDASHAPINAEFIIASAQQIIPKIRGYGVIQPAKHIDNLAEVSGRVTYIHPKLVSGTLLEKDTLIVQIDDVDYQLAYEQAQANVAITQAKIVELEQNNHSLQKNLALAEEKLVFSETEFTRKEALRKKNTISQSVVDAERIKVIQLQQEVTSLKQQLAVIPSQKNVLVAQLKSSKAEAQQQQRNIERTQIRMPVTGRITETDIEIEQFINIGQNLFQVHGIAQVEVEAQFTLEQFAPFIELYSTQMSNATATPSIENFIAAINLTGTLYLPIAPNEQWQADVVSIREQLDSQSRTIGIVFRVDNPYQNIKPGKRPPLLDGMHVEIYLSGAPILATVVADKAYHQGKLYIADGSNKLQKKSIEPLLNMGSVFLFDAKAFNKVKVITSDLIPAIEGMPLSLNHNKTLQDSLAIYLAPKEK